MYLLQLHAIMGNLILSSACSWLLIQRVSCLWVAYKRCCGLYLTSRAINLEDAHEMCSTTSHRSNPSSFVIVLY
jgi:hypothetical protein